MTNRKPNGLTVVVTDNGLNIAIKGKRRGDSCSVETYPTCEFMGVQFSRDSKISNSAEAVLFSNWGSDVLSVADKNETLPDWVYDSAAYYLGNAIQSEDGVHEELTLESVAEDLEEYHNGPSLSVEGEAMVSNIVNQAKQQDELLDWMVKNYSGNSAVDRDLGHYMTIPLKLLNAALGVSNLEFEEAVWTHNKEMKE